MLKTKSVRSPIKKTDGLRILISRFRGRGLSTTRYDVWMANLGPSEALLKRWKAGRMEWNDFASNYRKEILSDSDLDARNRTIKNHGQKFTLRLVKELARRQTVTLLCQCAETEQHCHRHVLRKLIQSRAV